MTEIHTLAGAYVLDAVDDIERAAFRRHLAECEACTQEVAELQEAAGRLTDLTWRTPPPTMREEVLAKVSQTPQVRAGEPSKLDATAPVGPWRRRAVMAAAAGIAVLAVAGGIYIVQEQRIRDEREQLAAIEARAEQIDAVLSAPDASLRQAPVPGSGTVTVVGSRQRDQAVVVLELPDPAADQAYELWLGTEDGLTSAGVLPARLGSTTTLVNDLGDANVMGVSLEPAGGSPTGQPTPGQIVTTVTLA